MDGLLPQSHHKTLLLDYQLPAHLQELEKLAAAVEEALPEHPDLAFSVNLCLDELITNTILHGLQGAQNRLIRVRMNISAQLLEIFIKDDAPHFDPFLQAPIPDLDLDLDERQVGGLGVHLVKTLMDDVRTYYDGSGNLIVLLKNLRKEA